LPFVFPQSLISLTSRFPLKATRRFASTLVMSGLVALATGAGVPSVALAANASSSGTTAAPSIPADSKARTNSSTVLLEGPAGAGLDITAADLRAEAEQRIPPDARKMVLGNPVNVQGQAKNLYVRRALANEAEQSGLAKDPVVQAEVRLARDRVLSDARLSQIDAAHRPSEADLEAFARTQYDANPKTYMEPERVHVRHILVKASTPDARKVAEGLLKQLQKGADFATLAKAHSDDPGSAAKGGDLGPLEQGRTVPPFDAAMFALTKPGELSPIVETKFGFHILKLIERLPAGERPFADVKDMLVKQAATTLAKEARTKEAERLLTQAKPDQAAIDAFAKNYK
jgi:peptidyl-prolyl cis-trans isomerase C